MRVHRSELEASALHACNMRVYRSELEASALHACNMRVYRVEPLMRVYRVEPLSEVRIHMREIYKAVLYVEVSFI